MPSPLTPSPIRGGRLAVWAVLSVAWVVLLVLPWSSSVRAQDANEAPAAEAPAAAPAPAAPAAPEAPKAKSFLWFAIEASGTVGFVLFVLSIYMTAVVIRLFMEFRLNDAVPPPLVEKLEEAIKERKFQEAYDACREDNSFLARMVRTGVANLPNGRPEAKEAMNATSEEVVVGMEAKVSYLAVIGTLGPMLGLLGTVWGMILAFQSISTSGAQPRPDQLAGNIATALFTTLEGVIVAVPAIFFFAMFRNRISIISVETAKVAERTINAFWNAAKQQPGGAKAPV